MQETRALALPDPAALAVGRAHELLAQVVEWASAERDQGRVLEALHWASAVERLLAPRRAEGPARTAARLLEARIGELDVTHRGGRGKRAGRGTVSLSRSRRLEFRLMAEHRELWAGRLPLSRSQVLAMIRRARPPEAAALPRGAVADLRLGDFRECLADVPDGSVDLVVTDPPYPLEYLPLWRPLAELSARVLRPGGLLLAMCGPMILPDVLDRMRGPMEYRWTLAWSMATGTETRCWPRRVSSRWKPVVAMQRPGDPRDGWVEDLVDAGDRQKELHPWQQGATGFVNLLRAVRARPGQLVLDPFAGTGTTGVAALGLGLGFIGCDTDPEALAVARLRLGAG